MVECIQTVKTATETSCGSRSPGCARRGAESAVGGVTCQQAAESGISMVAGKVDANLAIAQCNQLSGEEIKDKRKGSYEKGAHKSWPHAHVAYTRCYRKLSLSRFPALSLCLRCPKNFVLCLRLPWPFFTNSQSFRGRLKL